MLKVKTYIKESTIPNDGIGCFAGEDIKKGDLIWELNPFMDRIYTDENLKVLSELEREFVKIYAFKCNNLYYLCIDNARFFNHSETDYNTFDPINVYCTYANRDIQKDEEIISDYSTFGLNENDKEFNMYL